MWLLVGVEHGIILVKQLMAGLIPDTPDWVNKALVRVELRKSELGQQDLELEKSEQLRVLEEVKKAIKSQAQKSNSQMEEVRMAFSALQESVSASKERIKMLEQEKQEIRDQLMQAHSSGRREAEEISKKYKMDVKRIEKES